MALDRRRFLHLSALGIVATVADTGCAAFGDRAAADKPQLVAMLGPERVRELGAHYRASTPSENTAGALRAAISNGHSSRIPLLGSGSLDDQIRDDFAAGRTVVVDGWVLSVTEARQAALFSLTAA
jgi:anaerobic selenocysteine-containing dehydrogenase